MNRIANDGHWRPSAYELGVDQGRWQWHDDPEIWALVDSPFIVKRNRNGMFKVIQSIGDEFHFYLETHSLLALAQRHAEWLDKQLEIATLEKIAAAMKAAEEE